VPEPHSKSITARHPKTGDAYDVAAQVVRSNSNIVSVTLVTYAEGPNWGELPDLEKRKLSSLAKGVRQDTGKRVFSKVPAIQVSAEELQLWAKRLTDGELLGLISRVELCGGRSAHIPMMDFACRPSAQNLASITHLLSEITKGAGFLLESGRSYHYYGAELLTDEEWRRFIGRCLLMFGYVDDRYIGHQLVDGHCVLRLSAGRLKSRVPAVVAQLP
jgi:hypothetical protein